MTAGLPEVKTAVVTVAGYGTRSLPFTKALPKVMLPLVDKPGVQFIVEEAVLAGIEEVIFITSSNQHSIEDHFDSYYELEERLRQSGKTKLLEEIRRVSDLAHFVFTRQKEQLGNADAVKQARSIVGNSAFCVQFGDDVVLNPGGPAFLQQLKNVYAATQADAVIATLITDDEGASKYAIVETEDEGEQKRVTSITEKPGPEATTSRLASVAGFLFTPMIFDYIDRLKPEDCSGGEPALADAIKLMVADGKRVYTSTIEGQRIDIGNKLLYMKGAVEVALKHAEIGDDFREYLKSLTL